MSLLCFLCFLRIHLYFLYIVYLGVSHLSWAGTCQEQGFCISRMEWLCGDDSTFFHYLNTYVEIFWAVLCLYIIGCFLVSMPSMPTPWPPESDQTSNQETYWSLWILHCLPLVFFESISYCPLHLSDLSWPIWSFYFTRLFLWFVSVCMFVWDTAKDQTLWLLEALRNYYPFPFSSPQTPAQLLQMKDV